MLAVLSGGLLAMGPQVAFSQGEAVNADDIISKKTASEPIQKSIENKDTQAASETEKSLAAAKAELGNKEVLAKKVALATEMHQIRPTRDQVDSAVMRTSLSLAESDRQPFVSAMRSMLNYNAIERISIDSMVETYTLIELESMVEYYSKPEAKSASRKIIYWAKGVQPEIIRMIDKAMMRIKTGQ